ncbi:phage holin family protein [Gryllotalpicola ginsengisoli]|uniref:phage holin family protein n=1 Tax=Gryllotalpicola ginsengisoli TaxID=444608 RepID=UPI0003B73428|nr:phage holin family protein [Gryllotalpicola ginsengisoli]
MASRSLVELVSELPQLFIGLLKAELNQLKAELSVKAKNAAFGAAMFGAALVIVLLLVPVLVTAAILAFCLIVPPWAAALIVAGIMVVVIAVLVIIGITFFKRIGSAAPEQTITSVKSDVDAVRGVGDYDF